MGKLFIGKKLLIHYNIELIGLIKRFRWNCWVGNCVGKILLQAVLLQVKHSHFYFQKEITMTVLLELMTALLEHFNLLLFAEGGRDAWPPAGLTMLYNFIIYFIIYL